MEILCFFAGMVFIFTKSTYPLYCVLITLFFRPKVVIVVWFVTAILWGYFHQIGLVDQGMPNQAVIKHAILEGEIVSIPVITTTKTQFQFLVKRLNGQPAKASILLSCNKNCPLLHAGQLWQLQAKLKKPHNLANPGGFDYVTWLKARHINWTGYTHGQTFESLDKSEHHSLLSLREHLAALQAKINPDEKTLGILQALTLGVTTHIDQEEWALFRRTGTIHLMVISGAHIGLVASLTYGFIKWLWSCCGNLCLRCPAPKIASIAAIFMALLYALLAGFAVPAQRALIACTLMMARNFCSRRFGGWQAWRYALLGVLLFEPHSVLMPGFYLSFIAVAILILINQRLPWKGVKNTLSMQLACLFGLMPLTLFWFSYGAVNGLVANLLAIPWVSFIIVPLSLFITLLCQWFNLTWLIVVLQSAINLLLYYLQSIDSFALLNLNFSFNHVLPPLALMVGMALALLLPLSSLLPATILLVLASIFPAYEKVKWGEARIDVLDVGQGLAVTVRTAKHMLIYDTGIKFYQGSDMGKLVIIPYLKTLGIGQLDKVIISHPDLDHRGGLLSLEENFQINELIVDDPKFYKRGLACHDYPSWVWDGVSFRFFAIKKILSGKNNHSCILQIKTKEGQALLTGDIEKRAEYYLVNTYGTQLSSSVLLIPHHGSKTSSSLRFLKQVSPRYAIASYAADNQYRFPHHEAMQRYQQQKIITYNTADCGMVSVLLGPQKLSSPTCFS